MIIKQIYINKYYAGMAVTELYRHCQFCRETSSSDLATLSIVSMFIFIFIWLLCLAANGDKNVGTQIMSSSAKLGTVDRTNRALTTAVQVEDGGAGWFDRFWEHFQTVKRKRNIDSLGKSVTTTHNDTETEAEKNPKPAKQKEDIKHAISLVDWYDKYMGKDIDDLNEKDTAVDQLSDLEYNEILEEPEKQENSTEDKERKGIGLYSWYNTLRI